MKSSHAVAPATFSRRAAPRHRVRKIFNNTSSKKQKNRTPLWSAVFSKNV